jgi:hypothetical protein
VVVDLLEVDLLHLRPLRTASSLADAYPT